MLDGHSQDVKFVLWHPRADNVLFSCSYDDSIKVWGCDEGDDEFYCLHTLTGKCVCACVCVCMRVYVL